MLISIADTEQLAIFAIGIRTQPNRIYDLQGS